ncbi:hypothetical protein ACOSQ3_013208 [Xanthoceras sorbifolium]
MDSDKIAALCSNMKLSDDERPVGTVRVGQFYEDEVYQRGILGADSQCTPLCMTRDIGLLLGSRIGTVSDIDLGTMGDYVGDHFLRNAHKAATPSQVLHTGSAVNLNQGAISGKMFVFPSETTSKNSTSSGKGKEKICGMILWDSVIPTKVERRVDEIGVVTYPTCEGNQVVNVNSISKTVCTTEFSEE